MAGATKDNKNAVNGQKAKQALLMAIASKGKDKTVISTMQVLYDIWKVQVKKAMEGDQPATNAIMDRLDGRPGQAIILSGDEDNPITIQEVKRIIVKPKDTNG